MSARRQCGPLLLAIVGGSGAGKTWLADRLCAALPGLAARLALDDFYRDLSHLSLPRRERVNFDHPRAIEWPLVEATLRAILAGRPTRLPRYDFSTHCRRRQPARWQPRAVVICDGLWWLRRPGLRKLFHRRIYVDCPARLCLERRIDRDVRERGRSRPSVVRQFREDVFPMFERFVAPQSRWAELRLESPVSQADVDRLAAEIRGLLRKS